MNVNIILEQLANQIQQTHWAEYIAITTAIIYLILATKENIWCWFWGIISCCFWAYMTWYAYNLYFETFLQFFYIAISFQGIYAWKYGNQDKKERLITSLSLKENVILISTGIIISLLFGKLGAEYTTAAATYLDAFTTVFSILTTYLVIYKKLDNWIYWFFINSANVYLYWGRGGYFFALLFVVYIIISVFGYRRWRKELIASLPKPD